MTFHAFLVEKRVSARITLPSGGWTRTSAWEPGVPGLFQDHQAEGGSGVGATDDPDRGSCSPGPPGPGTVVLGPASGSRPRGPRPARRAGARMGASWLISPGGPRWTGVSAPQRARPMPGVRPEARPAQRTAPRGATPTGWWPSAPACSTWWPTCSSTRSRATAASASRASSSCCCRACRWSPGATARWGRSPPSWCWGAWPTCSRRWGLTSAPSSRWPCTRSPGTAAVVPPPPRARRRHWRP